jgi:chromosome segregation ATPase
VPITVTPEPEIQEDSKTTPNNAGDGEPDKTDDKTEDTQSRYQEEIHGYVERIDALEAKLQFLAREATDSARKAALAAPAASAEKKLAEKDQQIAQLIEEGKNLASTDHKHRALVKKLRINITENEKELGTLRTAKAKSDREIENLRGRARRADELEKAHDDLQRRLDQTQKELSTLRPEVRSKDSTIAELRAQLQKATEQADAMTAKVNAQAREQDKRRIADLEEEVAALKVEKTLVADRGKAQATELREKAERASERARVLELELKAEVQVMEGKLEAMRMRAEEASSGVAGDSQAKLLRQVETLQTQYSIAGENWQGIETTLLARIAGLEKERDEALQRESDMRRKAREAVSVLHPKDLYFVALDGMLTSVGRPRKAPGRGTGRSQDQDPHHPGRRQDLPNPTRLAQETRRRSRNSPSQGQSRLRKAKAGLGSRKPRARAPRRCPRTAPLLARRPPRRRLVPQARKPARLAATNQPATDLQHRLPRHHNPHQQSPQDLGPLKQQRRGRQRRPRVAHHAALLPPPIGPATTTPPDPASPHLPPGRQRKRKWRLQPARRLQPHLGSPT